LRIHSTKPSSSKDFSHADAESGALWVEKQRGAVVVRQDGAAEGDRQPATRPTVPSASLPL